MAVDWEAVVDFIGARSRVILIAIGKDGRPQSSPTIASVDRDGRIVTVADATGLLAATARQSSNGSALVLSDHRDGPWIQVWGQLEVIDQPDAIELSNEHHRTADEEAGNNRLPRAARLAEGKCILRLDIESWGPIERTVTSPPRSLEE